jgi:predicted PurR-regulated permease PerM
MDGTATSGAAEQSNPSQPVDGVVRRREVEETASFVETEEESRIDVSLKETVETVEGEEHMPLPTDPMLVFTAGLFMMALLACLYVAREMVLPFILAITLKLLLEPAMRLLERMRVPRVVGALLAIVLVFGLLGGLGTMLASPAASWAGRLPTSTSRIEEKIGVFKRPLDAFRGMAQRVQEAISGKPKDGEVKVQQAADIPGMVVRATRMLLEGLLTTAVFLFFMLLSGDTFLRRLVEILPTLRDKRQAVAIGLNIERDISAYLLTITAMNALVGTAAGVAVWMTGLGDPLLWGTIAFLLNYLPILGPVIGIAIFGIAGLVTFDTTTAALMPALLYLIIHLIEGEGVTPALLARRFTLNPVAVILSIVFWYWMWSVPGAILAVPMLAAFKIAADRIRPLRAFGHLLSG